MSLDLQTMDATNLYPILNCLVKSADIKDQLLMISTIEKVCHHFRSVASNLWISFARDLNIPITPHLDPKKAIQKCMVDIKVTYPQKLVMEIGLMHLIRFPYLDLRSIDLLKKMKWPTPDMPSTHWNNFPLILKGKFLSDSIMKGFDFGNRPFLAVKCENERNEIKALTLHRTTNVSDGWTFAQENGIYGKIEFTDQDANFCKIKRLLAEEAIHVEAPMQRNMLKLSK